MKGLLWHEMGHLTINDLTKKHFSKVSTNGKTVHEDFVKNFYPDIETIINEYIIRAITIRLCEITNDLEWADYLIKNDKKKGFKEVESIKNFILKNNEKENRFIKDDSYIELMKYVLQKI